MPSHTYGAAGTHDVTLTVTDDEANTSQLTRKVTSSDTGLVARFRTKKDDANNLKIWFNGEYSHDAAGDDVYHWHWDFGDGSYYDEGGSAPGDYDWLLVDNSTRISDWTYCGIPGGIPNRTTIYTTLSPGATTSQINAAIVACPDEQVVYLNAGTYSGIGTLNFTNSNMVLRGAGPGVTTINLTGSPAFLSSDPAFSQAIEEYNTGTEYSIASGYTKGSQTITMSATPPSGLTVGKLIAFRQDDQSGLVRHSGGSNARILCFLARCTAKSGNDITFDPPIPFTLTAGLNPKLSYITTSNAVSLIGIEDMTLNFGGAATAIRWLGADRCWFKNLDFLNWSGQGIWLYHCFQNEVRKCYFRDATGYGTGLMADGYPVYLYDGTSCCLVEDNISYRTGPWLGSKQSNNAFLYNYAYYSMHYSTARQIGQLNCNHGPHGLMTLWEGNIAEQFQNDGYHGSTSHQMIFRNWFHGLHPTATTNRKMIDLARGSYYCSAVGNVLGDPSWTPVAYEMSGAQGYINVIYRLGYPDMEGNELDESQVPDWIPTYLSSYPDTLVSSTILRHGNYDDYNNAVVWDGAIGSHAIPNSLFHTSKPSYFGSLQWPPIGPDVSGYHTDTPSKDRFDAITATAVLNDAFVDRPTYPLKASANGRYLVDQNNVPFLMVADCPQGLMVCLSVANANTYFASRANYGINVLWANLIAGETFGGRSNFTTYDGIAPFSTPGDYSTPNENYFARVDAIINAAANYGITIMLNAAECIDSLANMRTNGVTKCYNFGAYLGNRYKDFKNLIWMYGNDFWTWYVESDNNLVKAVANGILSVDSNHLHTLLLDTPSNSNDGIGWQSIVGMNGAYTYYPTYAEVVTAYNLGTVKPAFLFETDYEYENGASDNRLRREAYWTYLSGGCGYIYGNHYIYPFPSNWTSYLNTNGIIQLKYCKNLLLPRAWYSLVPDQGHAFVTSGYGTYVDGGTEHSSISSNDYATASLTADGTLGIVYIPTARTVTVDMSKFSASVVARWYDPSLGTFTDISGSPFANSGTQNFTSSGTHADGTSDWVLVLET